MRVLALCMLLLQAWACPTVVAGAASVEGTSTISLSQQVSQSHNALGMVDVDLFQEDDQVIGARRQLLKKKKSPPKKGRSKKPSKKPFKKPSKKSTKKSKKKSPKKGKPGKPGKSGTPGFPGFDGTPGGPGSNGADGIPGTPGANAPAGAPGLAGPPGTPASLGLPTGVSAVALGYNNAIYKGPALEGSVAGTPGDFVDTVLRFNVDCNFLNTNQAARDQFALYIRLSIALDLGLYDNAGNLELWRVQIIAGPSCGSTLYTIRIFFFNRSWSSTTISARLLGGNPFISGTPFFNQYRAIFIAPTPVIIPSPVVG